MGTAYIGRQLIGTNIWTLESNSYLHVQEQDTSILGLRMIVSGNASIRITDDLIKLDGRKNLVLSRSNEAMDFYNQDSHIKLRIFGIDFHAGDSSDHYINALHETGLFDKSSPTVRISEAKEPLLSLAMNAFATPLKGMQKEIYLCGIAYQFLAMILDCGEDHYSWSATSSYDAERIDCVKCILRRECRNPPCIEKLAKSVGLGRKKLSGLFRKQCGIGINDFLHEYRMKKAYHLIQYTKLQVSEIAYEVGYTPAHLSTAFKKKFGLLPTAIRSHAH